MLSQRVIASGISNLSDARYFAAYGVEWMTFPTSRTADNIGTIKEIIDWCEGPKFGVELIEEDPEYLSFLIDELKISGVIVEEDWIEQEGVVVFLKKEKSTTEVSDESPRLILTPEEVDQQKVDRLSQSYVDTSTLEPKRMREIMQTHPSVGWVLYGDQEEKVGFKSFENQEELIEVLLDFQG